MRLTKAMLDAMDTALAELLAGCGVQGVFNEAEADEIIRNAHKAQAWVWQELDRRTGKRTSPTKEN